MWLRATHITQAIGLDAEASVVVESSLQNPDISSSGKAEALLNPIQHLQLKFITEPGFRKQLIDDPKAALRAVGIEPSEDILSILQDLEEDLAKLAKQLGVETIDCV